MVNTLSDRHHRLRWWGLAAISLGVALIIMDSTIVSVAMPSIIEDLSLTTTQVQWVQEVYTLDPAKDEQLAMAHAYNAALIAGVELSPDSSIPVGTGQTVSEIRYRDVLNASADGVMGRIRIESIGVDLPIYHGTDAATLERGAGHLEGSHLPVGGESTRAVITAHRGLATSTLFTHLVRVDIGDRFQILVLGEVLTYEVIETKVIDPSDSDSLLAEPGRDLVTLVTCTPLGINSHRILVTGERVTPTPVADQSLPRADADPDVTSLDVGLHQSVTAHAPHHAGHSQMWSHSSVRRGP